jgi:tetratricopeptide (TPR) repeat protein
MHYKGSRKRLDEIAAELGVDYVLEGTVRRSGERLRIGARLVRRADQAPLWAESYERAVADVLDIQSEVSRQVAAGLAIELLAPAGGGVAATTNAAAYEVYLKGRYYWNRRGPTDLERAVTLLEEAVAADASFAGGWAGLADALNVLPWYGLCPPRDCYPRAKQAASRALELDDTSASAHTALAYAYHYYDWSWADAEREFRRVLALNTSYAQAHQWLAAHYAELGRTEEALVEIRLAEQLDPRSAIIAAAVGWIHYLGRQFDPAIARLAATLEAEPDFIPARLWLGQALEAAGRPAEAIAHYERVRQLAGGSPTGLGELARGYASVGRRAEARATLERLRAVAGTRYVEADVMARAHAALGEAGQALAWLERGFEERAVKMVLIGVDPQFDSLRGDPRFQDLVRRLDLPR